MSIGDSITVDVIAPTDGAYRTPLSPLLAASLKQPVVWCGDNTATGNANYRNYKICGASGQRIDEINTTYVPGTQVARWRPDLVIIHIGTNDATQINSGTFVSTIATSVASLRTMLTSIFAAKPDTAVCLCKIIPNQTAGADTLIDEFNSLIVSMVAGHPYASRIFFADCNAAFKADPSWATNLMGDGTHPNAAGDLVICNTIMTALSANISFPTRPQPPKRRKASGGYTNSLFYAASTATTLGAGATLNTALPWAVSFDVNLERCPHSTASANGILALITDQATPFVFLTLNGSSNRGFEFGSSANFGRFFPNSGNEVNVYQRFARGFHQFTVTFDGVSRTTATSYKFYLDGFPINLTSGAGLAATTSVNEIGRVVSGGTAGTFEMASLRIWNGGSVMTPAQARALYLDGTLPTGPTLIRNYTHSDGSGATLTDATGNQNGTIGTATWGTSVPIKARTFLART